MTNKRKQSDFIKHDEMKTSTALAWFAVALLLAMMLSSCTAQKGSFYPCYYFANKGGQKNAQY